MRCERGEGSEVVRVVRVGRWVQGWAGREEGESGEGRKRELAAGDGREEGRRGSCAPVVR